MSSSNSAANLLAILGKGPQTLGWDVIVAYNAAAVNDLFAEQYVTNLAAGQAFPPLAGSFTSDGGTQLQFSNLTLGPPLLAFGSSDALVTMNFLAGTSAMITKNPFKEVDYVTQLQQFAADETEITITVPVTKGTGELTKNNVVIDFTSGTYQWDLLGTSQAGLLGQTIQDLVAKQTEGTTVYTLGALSPTVPDPGEIDLTPYSFDIRLQKAPDGVSGGGAVLLLVATTFNPNGGNLPGTNYPWLIPDGYRATLLVSNQTLMSNLIGPYLSTNLVGGPTFTSSDGSDGFTTIAAAGSFDAGKVTGEAPIGTEIFFWSGTRYDTASPVHVFIPYDGLTLDCSSDLMTVNWSHHFPQTFGSEGPNNAPTSHTVSIVINANLTAAIEVGANDVISFQGSGVPDITASNVGFFGAIGGFGAAAKKLETQMQPVVNAILNYPLPAVDVFAVSHLLFPTTDSAFTSSSPHLPGDVAVFGDILKKDTSIVSISPLQTVVGAGEAVLFTVNGAGSDTVTWSVSNIRYGSIDQTGNFTAAKNPPSAGPIIITAETSSGTAIAAVTILTQTAYITPAFAFLAANPSDTLEFALGGSDDPTVIWSVNPPGAGTLTANTSPSATFAPTSSPAGAIEVATITATTSVGSSSALVAIMNEAPALQISPAWISVSSDQTFTTTKTVTWTVAPSNAGSVTSSGVFTAPSSPPDPPLALVIGQSANGSVGYAVAVITASSGS